MSMSLAVPGARLYVNEINLAVSRGTRYWRPVKMSPALMSEIEHWFFFEPWDGFLPRRSESTYMLSCPPTHLASLGEVL